MKLLLKNMPKIKDIATFDMLYYDRDAQKECARFCINHHIRFLPDINDFSIYWEFSLNTGFKKQPLISDLKIDIHDYIFSSKVLKKFKKSELLFVTDSGQLTGVIHYTDYNKDVVNVFLFSTLISLEKLLRTLLVSLGYSTTNMLTFFAHHADKSEYYKLKYREAKELLNVKSRDLSDVHFYDGLSNDSSMFSEFFLVDLIDLVNHLHIMKLNRRIQNIRNRIMHAKTLVKKSKEFTTSGMLKDFESFSNFFEDVFELISAYKKVKNKLKLLGAPLTV